MRRLIIAAAAALALAGCAADKDLLKAQADAAVATGNARVAEANAAAEEARAVIALAGKVDAGGASAYLVAKAMKGLGATPAPQQVIQTPQSALGAVFQAVLQVADVGLRAWGVKAGRDVAIASTNAQRDTAIASYGAFTSMGSSIATAGTAGYPYVQAPQPNITNTLSGTGVIGSGSYIGPVTTTRTCNGGAGAAGGNGAGTTTGGAGGVGGAAPGGTC